MVLATPRAKKGFRGRDQGLSHQELVHRQLPNRGRDGERRVIRELQLSGLRVRHRAQGLWLHTPEQRRQLLARDGPSQRPGTSETADPE